MVTEKVPLQIWISAELKTKLKQMAWKARRPLASYVRIILEDHIEAEAKKMEAIDNVK